MTLNSSRLNGPTAPRKRFYNTEEAYVTSEKNAFYKSKTHSLTNLIENQVLQEYELKIKNKFDQIVPVLKKISTYQHEDDFVVKAKEYSKSHLGFELPNHLLENTWVKPLDMRELFAWSVFQSHQQVSSSFFSDDPLSGSEKSDQTILFQSFLEECGFHLLDITPCSDGRLAHTVAYALRIPFSAVRRRSHAGALFDIEKTVNRWIKTEHRRHREGLPNKSTKPTRYLKIVTYHFSSLDPYHQGCAAHGSNDSAAAKAGFQRLLDFREAIENSFCCGASVDLLLIGIDTDNDSLRIHLPSAAEDINLKEWISTDELYKKTLHLSPDDSLKEISEIIKIKSETQIEKGMADFIIKIISNNFSQIDYVKQFYDGKYPDAGHAERFIGVGIGFKEVHLRNLTYFAHLDTVEEGAPDLDVGIKIFKGLNVSRNLPIPIVIRFDYSGRVPGAKDRAIEDCMRVNDAINTRYKSLVKDGMLHTLLTIRDRDKKAPAEVVGSSLNSTQKEVH